jgi:ferredoxin-NADP reductase
MPTDEPIVVEVHAIKRESASILSYDLRLPGGGSLPAFAPGAHIDVHLEVGLSRSYSLINSVAERFRYLIAIDRASPSRGGSRWIHENVSIGDILRISSPRNHFALEVNAPHSVLIAGGIGITPLLAMCRHLEAHQRSWELHYCVRDQERAAFAMELSRQYMHGRVSMYLSMVHGRPDLNSIADHAATGTHFYCCGPPGMLEAFLRATKQRDPRFVHTEHFTGAPAVRAGGFDVILATCGRTLRVNTGETILDRLIEEGIEVPNSCREGVCGSCEVPLIAGKADHRDMILTDAEKEANTSIFVCCSGSLTQSLTLSL